MVLFSLYSAERAVVMTTLVDDVIIHKQIPAAFQSAAIQGFFLEGFSWLRFSIEVLFSFLLVDTPFEKKIKLQIKWNHLAATHLRPILFILFIFFPPFSPQRLRIIFFHDYVFKCGQSVSVCVCVE